MVTKARLKVLVRGNTQIAQFAKPVEAIYIRPTKGTLTLQMHRAYNIMLARATEQGTDKDVYRMSIANLGAELEFDSKNTEFLKETIRKLQGLQVEWDYITEKGRRKWGVSSMLASAEIEEGGGGMIEYTFAPHLKEKLLRPDVYARINLRLQNKFRSRHSLALYEQCARYKDNPSRVTARLPWQEWAAMIVSPADDQALYIREFKYFSRDILKPSINEVNRVADDFEIEALVEKEGRRVTSIQFHILPKQQAALSLSEPAQLYDPDLRQRIEQLGIAIPAIVKLFTEYEEQVLRSALEYTEKRLRSKRSAPVENPGAYFMDTLAKNYASPPSDTRTLITGEPTPLPYLGKTAEKPKNELELFKTQFLAARAQDAELLFDEMAETEKNAAFSGFLDTIGNSIHRASLHRGGPKGKMGRRSFFLWFAEHTWGTATQEDMVMFAAKQMARR